MQFSFSQPVKKEEYKEFSEVEQRWNKAFGDLDNLFRVNNSECEDERTWLLNCCSALRIIDEIKSIAEKQRIAILQSIRSEFPIRKNTDEFISEEDLLCLDEDELIAQDRMILQQYGIEF